MKYTLTEMRQENMKDDFWGYTCGFEINWDYQNPTRPDDKWHSMMEHRDWLHGQFGLNRGYKYVSWNGEYSYVVFKNHDDMLMFKLVF